MVDQETPWMGVIVVVWVVALVMTLLFFAFANVEPFITGLVMVSLAGMALGATYLILEHIRAVAPRAAAGPAQEAAQEAAQATEKSKRSIRERVERLVEMMDEDEVVELETLLLARDDDQVAGDSYR